MPRTRSRRSSRSHHRHDGEATPFSAEPEKAEASESGSDHVNDLHEHEYLSGSRLVFVLSGLTLAVFLMLLDASIVATVSIQLGLQPSYTQSYYAMAVLTFE